MQMFGVGILEIMVILVLAVLVVGPERLPQVSAELAQWIRRGRAYARHLTSDFKEVVSELEEEVGASKEDWKEIASVVSTQTKEVTQELDDTTAELKAIEREDAKRDAAKAVEATGRPADTIEASEPASAEPAVTLENQQESQDGAESPSDDDDADDEEKPWYEPEQAGRRRNRY